MQVAIADWRFAWHALSAKKPLARSKITKIMLPGERSAEDVPGEVEGDTPEEASQENEFIEHEYPGHHMTPRMIDEYPLDKYDDEYDDTYFEEEDSVVLGDSVLLSITVIGPSDPSDSEDGVMEEDMLFSGDDETYQSRIT